MKFKVSKIMFVIILLSLSALACNALSGIGGGNSSDGNAGGSGSESGGEASGGSGDVELVSDIPVTSDAFSVVDTSAFGLVAIVYNSNMSIEDIANFYKEEMPNHGYELSTEAITADAAAMTFDDNRISIAVAEDPNSDANVVTIAATP